LRENSGTKDFFVYLTTNEWSEYISYNGSLPRTPANHISAFSRTLVNFALHPLIHTFPPKSSTQDLEKKKAESLAPHFLSLNQNIVAGSQDEKCGVCNMNFRKSTADSAASGQNQRSTFFLTLQRSGFPCPDHCAIRNQ
jgi:hypothetical protein